MALSRPNVLIPKGLGINSHEELGYVFRMAGADVDYVHWNELIKNPCMLDQYNGLGLPGGFTMGDQLGAGQSLANRIAHSGLAQKLAEKLDDPDFIVYSVCNCLQLSAKLNLMPFPVGTVQNDSGKHETTSWDIGLNSANDSVWISYLKECKEPVFAPVSHGEGRIIVPPKSLQEVNERNYAAMKYAQGHMCQYFSSSRGSRYNPNGSTDDIAGFAWKGNIELFPHFERLHHNYQREDKDSIPKSKLKLPYEPTYLLFLAAVDEMKKK